MKKIILMAFVLFASAQASAQPLLCNALFGTESNPYGQIMPKDRSSLNFDLFVLEAEGHKFTTEWDKKSSELTLSIYNLKTNKYVFRGNGRLPDFVSPRSETKVFLPDSTRLGIVCYFDLKAYP